MTVSQHALLGAPHEYLTPIERPTLDEARAWCRHLASTHYENFHVATWFLPNKVRPHFESIYAYCRVADDLGDEVADPSTALRLLDAWGSMLDECYDTPERSMHPVFVALHETIRDCGVPRELFADLLHAFRMDQVKTTYDTWGELLEYSHYSANPVGRLVLWVCGYQDESIALLSDKVCTATCQLLAGCCGRCGAWPALPTGRCHGAFRRRGGPNHRPCLHPRVSCHGRAPCRPHTPDVA